MRETSQRKSLGFAPKERETGEWLAESLVKDELGIWEKPTKMRK